jgi:predicted nuclease with TOPRIM domain
LKETVGILENKLSSEQQSHSKEMKELSTNLREKMDRLQATNKNMSEEVRATHAHEIDTLRRRI